MPKPFTLWITTNCGKFWKRLEYQTTWTASWKICMQVKKQRLELDREQQTGSKSGKEYSTAVFYHPAFNLYAEYIMWNTGLDEAQARIKIARRNINNLRYADDTTLMSENEEELKSFLMKVKEENEKLGLKLKAECWRIDAFELWCWRRLMRVPCTARRSNKSILKEISTQYSLELLMLKMKLQYFGSLMWRADSLEKTWCWER